MYFKVGTIESVMIVVHTWNMLVHAVKLLFVDAQLTVAGLLVVLGHPPSFVCKNKAKI